MFATTAAYEASIADWFAADEPFPQRLTLSVQKAADLAYGENPHQRAAFYGQSSSVGEKVDGKPPSYNNLNDLSAGRALLEELGGHACVIVKHANPCGAAIAGSIEAAYEGVALHRLRLRRGRAQPTRCRGARGPARGAVHRSALGAGLRLAGGAGSEAFDAL